MSRVQPTRTLLQQLVHEGLSDAEIGVALRVTPRTVLRWRKLHQIPSQWQPKLRPCGTEAAYARGCHCTQCRTAHTAYHRAHR